MSLKGIIVGVDLDGVCADFYEHMRIIAAEWLECDESELTKDVSYGLAEWGVKPERYVDLHRFAVTQRDLFKTCPMIPGARKFLRKLSDEGARIRIVTHRLFIDFFHHAAVSQTIDWLDKSGIPYSYLCFMESKQDVGVNIFIEDSPKNVDLLRGEDVYTICFGNSTNKHVAEPRVESWGEVYDLVHEFAKKQKQVKDAQPVN